MTRSLCDAAADTCLAASAVIAARGGPRRPGLLAGLGIRCEELRALLEPRCDPLLFAGLQRDKWAFGLLVFAVEDFIFTGADPDGYPARVLEAVVMRISEVIAGAAAVGGGTRAPDLTRDSSISKTICGRIDE